MTIASGALRPLTTALREHGPSSVDGVPEMSGQSVLKGDTNQCPVPDCELPGGHAGPHQDAERQKFSWEPYGGRVDVEPADVPIEESSSDESEELLPDEPVPKKSKTGSKDEFFYAFEIPLDEAAVEFLTEHPRKATAWVPKKLESKGKEMRWHQMPLEQKRQFDEAQCKELSQVLTAKAVRSLTSQEEIQVDPKKVMQMRWVLTLKTEWNTESPTGRAGLSAAQFDDRSGVCSNDGTGMDGSQRTSSS